MADILKPTFSYKYFFVKDNKLVLVQAMAWHVEGDKPLPEPMMTQFIAVYIYIYMHHQASMGQVGTAQVTDKYNISTNLNIV